MDVRKSVQLDIIGLSSADPFQIGPHNVVFKTYKIAKGDDRDIQPAVKAAEIQQKLAINRNALKQQKLKAFHDLTKLRAEISVDQKRNRVGIETNKYLAKTKMNKPGLNMNTFEIAYKQVKCV